MGPITTPLLVVRFTAASTSGRIHGCGVTGASCDSVNGSPMRHSVLAGMATAERAAPQILTTLSPPLTIDDVRKLGIAPILRSLAIWSGRR